jgi:uncharacterized membrane protein SpoIIM required for sporulation
MSPVEFERRHGATWAALEDVLSTLDGTRFTTKARQVSVAARASSARNAPHIAELPELYRAVCHHFALASDRQYPQFLVERLHRLVDRAHAAMYQSRSRWWQGAWTFVAIEFPSLVRADKGLMALASALFCVPLVVMLIATWWLPEAVYSVFDVNQVAKFEDMYRPDARHIGRERGAGTDFAMFGHYIRNNIGISFQVFAGGLIGGIGSMFFLVANGLFIGAIAGYLTGIGYGGTFWQFVCGHGAFELTAIVISGGAGLRLGWALLAPGSMTRLDSLVASAKVAVRIIYGTTLMLVIAAFVEAFWSSSRWIGPEVKYAAAAMMWLGVAWYFFFQGRPRGPSA